MAILDQYKVLENTDENINTKCEYCIAGAYLKSPNNLRYL